jgi:hypothetical protein
MSSPKRLARIAGLLYLMVGIFGGFAIAYVTAMVYTTYGSPDVLKLKEIQKPTPQDDEVLIHVHGAAVNAGDRHLLRGDPFMIQLTAVYAPAALPPRVPTNAELSVLCMPPSLKSVAPAHWPPTDPQRTP